MFKNITPFALILVICFINYSVILSLGSLGGFPEHRYNNGLFPFLSEKPLSEDGFYSLAVSWNIASGYGITYNGKTPTTGFQPLSVFINSLLAFIIILFGGDKYAFLRAVIILSSVIQIVFAILIYLVASKLSSNTNKKMLLIVSLLSVLFNFKLFLHFVNGLETGMYLTGLACFIFFFLRTNQKVFDYRSCVLLGLFAGLLMLVRADFLVIFILFLIILMIFRYISIRGAILIIAMSVLVTIPWLVYVFSVTGKLVSSSITIQTGFVSHYNSVQRVDQFLSAIIHYFTPFLYTGIYQQLIFYTIGTIYIGLLILFFKKYHYEVIIRQHFRKHLIIVFPVILLTFVYLFYSSAPYFYFRYFAPLSAVTLPVIVIILSKVFQEFNRVLVSVVYFIIIAVFSIHIILYFHSGKSYLSYALRPGYIQKVFGDSVSIASFQTGTLGFFLPNVYNLDGKVDQNAIVYTKNNKLGRYVDSLKIDIMLSWKPYLQNFEEGYLENNWEVYSPDIGDSRSVCYIRKNINTEKYLK